MQLQTETEISREYERGKENESNVKFGGYLIDLIDDSFEWRVKWHMFGPVCPVTANTRLIPKCQLANGKA